MKEATVKDLRTKFPLIESWLNEGEAISITKHGRQIATLTAPARNANPDFATRFSATTQKHVLPEGKGAVDLLIEERGD